MNISDFAIKRPYFVFAILAAVLIFGSLSLSRIPVDLLPKVEMPSIIIMTPYPGAGPEEVEKNLIDPLERWLGTISGLKEIQSDARENVGVVQLTFDWGVNIDEVDAEVRERLDLGLLETPEEVGEPFMVKLSGSLIPQMLVAVSGGSDPAATRQIADDVSKRLQRVQGAAAADVMGGKERELLVEIDRRKLVSYEISPVQIEMVLKAHNLNYPLGNLSENGQNTDLRLVAEYEDLQELERTIIGSKGNMPVYLGDVARLSWADAEQTSGLNINGKPGISIVVQKRSGVNTIQLSKRLTEAIEEIRKDLPDGVELTILHDGASFIKTAVSSTFWNLVEGGILAVLVIFLFLGGFRSTFFVAASIPLSILLALIGVSLAGYRIDILSMAGLTVAIGMVVDASIVVFEAIHRHNKSGLPPREAASVGAKEVGSAITSSTITTLVVFIPLLFIRGFVSVLFTEFSWVVIFALGSSILVALLIIPMAASRYLGLEKKPPKLVQRFERFYTKLENVYKRIISWALGHRAYIVFTGLGLLVLSVTALFFQPRDFFPKMDQGELTVAVKAPAGTSLEEMERRVGKLEKLIVDSIPELKVMQTTIGSGQGLISTIQGVEGTNNARLLLYLVGKSKRSRSTEDIKEWLREKAGDQIPGMEITFAAEALGSIAFGAEDVALGGSTPVVVEIEGYDIKTADSLANIIADSLAQIRGIIDVRSSSEEKRPGIALKIRRDLTSRFGMTPYELGKILRTELAGAVATTYRIESKDYDVRLRLSEADRSSLSKIEAIEIKTPSGLVPLRNMVEIEISPSPIVIKHKGTNRILTVKADIKGRDLGSISEDVRSLLKRMPTPSGIKLRQIGGFKQMSESFADLWWILLIAIALVYLVMTAQFGSFRFPFIIMFTLPLALIGAVAMLILTGTTLNTFSFLGLIVLVGVIVNNGIVYIDYVNKLRRDHGMKLDDALKEAGRVRMRPILVTALTTTVGLFPMALGIGEGTEMTQPLAVPVLGGLLVGTFLTLIFIPVLYHLLEKPREKKAVKRH